MRCLGHWLGQRKLCSNSLLSNSQKENEYRKIYLTLKFLISFPSILEIYNLTLRRGALRIFFNDPSLS